MRCLQHGIRRSPWNLLMLKRVRSVHALPAQELLRGGLCTGLNGGLCGGLCLRFSGGRGLSSSPCQLISFFCAPLGLGFLGLQFGIGLSSLLGFRLHRHHNYTLVRRGQHFDVLIQGLLALRGVEQLHLRRGHASHLVGIEQLLWLQLEVDEAATERCATIARQALVVAVETIVVGELLAGRQRALRKDNGMIHTINSHDSARAVCVAAVVHQMRDVASPGSVHDVLFIHLHDVRARPHHLVVELALAHVRHRGTHQVAHVLDDELTHRVWHLGKDAPAVDSALAERQPHG
mmetsp:Transcript_10472/g.43302  ORF Transcript_10472/g.43302 Transcript_10472/m.43302 type:complete len:291 (-) Transcript_10472:3704-4576(-)